MSGRNRFVGSNTPSYTYFRVDEFENGLRSSSVTSSVPPLPGFPSPQEAKLYYYGLRISNTGVKSGPTLVYRTSKDVFVAEQIQHRELQLLAVQGHANLSKNNLWDTVRNHTVTILDNNKIKLTSVDLVRFCRKVTSNAPVISNATIWIGVLPNSTDARLARLSAERITFILKHYGINDIDIAFRESSVHRLAVPGPMLYPPMDADHPLKNIASWLTTSLSMPIADLNRPSREGTFGFYFKVGKDLYGVTARHVLFPIEHGNDYYWDIETPYSTTPNSNKKWVVIMGNLSYGELLESVPGLVKNMANVVKSATAKVERIQRQLNYSLGNVTLNELNEERGVLNNFEAQYAALKRFQESLEDRNQWGTIRNRVIGHVVWAPPISAPYYTQDVCVFKLVNEKFWPSMVNHVIQTGTGYEPKAVQKISKGCWTRDPGLPPDFPWPIKMSYRLLNILPTQDITKKKTIVFKCGRATGTTVGRVNEFTSFAREYIENQRFDSIEVSVMTYKSSWGYFSEKGDSGAAIIGGNNDFVALLTGGVGGTEGTDITYGTPFEWLWEEVIKRQFPAAQLFF